MAVVIVIKERSGKKELVFLVILFAEGKCKDFFLSR